MFIIALARGEWVATVVAAVITGASLFAQGRGHRIDSTPAEPFTGPLNAIARIFAEQWLTFPPLRAHRALDGSFAGSARERSVSPSQIFA
ncbi:MAG: hypothetical protein ACREPF_11995 [Rhodanobacteraceae bacterium]